MVFAVKATLVVAKAEVTMALEMKATMVVAKAEATMKATMASATGLFFFRFDAIKNSWTRLDTRWNPTQLFGTEPGEIERPLLLM